MSDLNRHPWLRSYRNELRDCAILAVIALACVGLMVLGSI